jgi:hypothetical protein
MKSSANTIVGKTEYLIATGMRDAKLIDNYALQISNTM